jgi:hypothetical protein
MKTHIPLNLAKLTRTEIVQRLQIGEPYHFIVGEPITAEHPIDESQIIPLDVGDYFSKWYATNEPGRVFRITAITFLAEGTVAYETVFSGFRILKEDGNGGMTEYLARDKEGQIPIPPPMTSNL